VAARVQTFAREGDEDARIQSVGFSLAATISKPPNLAAKQQVPAVILVPGSGPTDRDETVAGIPIFGQLAGALADAGCLVVRYDKRGVAQSGGRPEASTLSEYAEDVRAIVKYLSDRKDVDDRRVAVAGHSEGGLVALLAATREKKIGAVALIATPGTTGAELVLEQQRHALDRMKLPDAERQAKIDLQQKIHAAVASGKGWEDVPPAVRRQADTPWFQSFLAFDPAVIVPKVRQPLFIAHGELDRQVPVGHATRLADLAKARKNGGDAKLVTVPGVNHLLTTAKTGEVDEYGVLETKTISRQIVDALVAWLQTALPPRS
jgi:pimeloyl-ACP methyl ester carboxylesterase